MSADSPLGNDVRAVRNPVLNSVVRTRQGLERAADPLPLAGGGGRRWPIEYRFSLAARYAAKMWAVRVDTTTAKVTPRRVRVRAVDLAPHGGAMAQVFLVDDGTRVPGDPPPVRTLAKPLDTVYLDMASGKTLYVIVSNTSETQQGAATILVEDVTGEPLPDTPASPSTTTTGSGVPGAAKPTGYWKFLEPKPTRYKPGPDPAITVNSLDVTEGAISGTVTSDNHSGEGPAVWSGDCSWTWKATNGLDRLLPGDAVEVSLTVTDRSVPEKLSGWNHGRTGVSGTIRFDMPGLGLSATHRAASQLVGADAGWKQTTTPQKGTWKVPAGPGDPEWGGRASLVANCSFGKLERVYQWVTGPVEAAAPAPTVGAPRPPSVTGSWTGYWINSLGEKQPDSLVLHEAADGTVTGTWTATCRCLVDGSLPPRSSCRGERRRAPTPSPSRSRAIR